MKIYIILALFILASLSVDAQASPDKGIKTNYGLIINERTGGSPLIQTASVFLKDTENQTTEIKELKGYVVFDYSPLKNQLLVGKFNIRTDRSSTCQVFYTYDLITKKFTLQYDLNAEKHTDQFGDVKFSKGYDSIIIPNVRFGIDRYEDVIRKLK